MWCSAGVTDSASVHEEEFRRLDVYKKQNQAAMVYFVTLTR